MNSRWSRWRWPALLGAALVLLFAAGLVRPGVMETLGVHPLKPLYSDLIAILAAGDAQATGRDPYEHNPLDPFNRPHVYGPWWLVTDDLGLTRADAWWLGSLLMLAVAVAGAVWLAPRDGRGVIGAALSLLAPPMLLALERANNDLVVLLLLFGAAWAMTRRASWVGGLGGSAVVTAAALKLYPLAALPALAARATSRGRALGWVALAASACAAVTLASLATYRLIAAMAPEPLTIFGYGAKLTYYVLLTIPDQRLWLILGAIPLLTLVVGLGWRLRSALWRLVPATGLESAGYVAGAACWLLCYASTISFPYRLLLLLLPARLWLAAKGDAAARLQLCVALFLMWTPALKEHLLVLSADESQFTGSPVAWIALGAENAAALALALVLAVSLVGWTWRRFTPAPTN
ncbi:MAG: hypothetical protein RIS54_1015 [Verrucomicrobiota bacterium]